MLVISEQAEELFALFATWALQTCEKRDMQCMGCSGRSLPQLSLFPIDILYWRRDISKVKVKGELILLLLSYCYSYNLVFLRVTSLPETSGGGFSTRCPYVVIHCLILWVFLRRQVLHSILTLAYSNMWHKCVLIYWDWVIERLNTLTRACEL